MGSSHFDGWLFLSSFHMHEANLPSFLCKPRHLGRQMWCPFHCSKYDCWYKEIRDMKIKIKFPRQLGRGEYKRESSCKSHEKSCYWICKTLRDALLSTLSLTTLLFVCCSAKRGKEMISILLLLLLAAFSFRSPFSLVASKASLFIYCSRASSSLLLSDWNPIFLIQRSLITSWRLPSIFCTLLSLPIFFASLRHFINSPTLSNLWKQWKIRL